MGHVAEEKTRAKKATFRKLIGIFTKQEVQEKVKTAWFPSGNGRPVLVVSLI